MVSSVEQAGVFPNREEAVDHDGSGFAHSFSLRDTKMLIDIDLKRKEYDSTRID